MTLNGNPDNTNGYNSVIKNGEVADADLIKSPIPPIGSISELGTVSGTPTLPDGWVECDGSTLSDSDSPLNGQTIPNLNTTTSYWSANGCAFMPEDTNDAADYDQGDGRMTMLAGTGAVFCPVNLPHGAYVGTCNVSGVATASWAFIRVNNSGGNESIMASNTLNDPAGAGNTVNNSSYNYFLQINAMENGEYISTAEIAYTTSSNFIMRVK